MVFVIQNSMVHPPILLVLLLFLSGCATTYSSYVNPLEGNSNAYSTIPLKSDSLKLATYASALVTIGGSNSLNDLLFSFHGNIHKSHNWGIVQGYYGAGIALGSYRFYENLPYSNFSLNRVTPKYFGAYGINGGLNLVLNFNTFEWRAIGLETSVVNEFGKYLSFRKSQADSNLSVLETNGLLRSLGGTTEFLWKRKSGMVVGYKIAIGGFFIPDHNFRGMENFQKPLYFSNSIHLTKGNLTGFWQFNFGSYNNTFQMGVNYQLRKRTLKNSIGHNQK